MRIDSPFINPLLDELHPTLVFLWSWELSNFLDQGQCEIFEGRGTGLEMTSLMFAAVGNRTQVDGLVAQGACCCTIASPQVYIVDILLT